MRTDPYGNPLPDRMHYRRDGYEHVTSKRGKRTWTRLGTNYPQALAQWARIEGVGVGQNAATIAEMVEAYLIEHAERLAPKTMRGYRNSQMRINDWAGAVYGEELTRSSVRTWLHADGKGREVSANRDLALLKAALNLAVEMDLLSVNPAMGVRRLPERPRTRSGTSGELEALGKVATPMWCAIISTALFTGMRESEIRLLKRSQLRPDGIQVEHWKTGATTLVEWSPALRSVIQMALNIPEIENVWVFPSKKGGPYSEDGFRTVWYRLREQASVDGLQFRDLRRTAANYSGSLQAAQALLGHSDSRITGRVYQTIKRAKPTG